MPMTKKYYYTLCVDGSTVAASGAGSGRRFPEETTMRHTPNPMQAANPEIDAFNAAFDELGLDWHWDRATMAELAAITDDKERVRAYVSRHHPHLLKVYDADFISALVATTKARQG